MPKSSWPWIDLRLGDDPGTNWRHCLFWYPRFDFVRRRHASRSKTIALATNVIRCNEKLSHLPENGICIIFVKKKKRTCSVVVCSWTSTKINLSRAYLVYRMTGKVELFDARIQGFSKYTAVKSNYTAEIIRKEKWNRKDSGLSNERL